MSIRPTTRLGYRQSVRPHKWRVRELLDKAGTTNVEKFLRSREPRRMAGTRINANLIESGSAPTPYLKGDENLSRERDEIDLRSKNLDPDDLDPKEYG
jgi:hypothetical protein|tara:strand:+ start:645 stop:938 length:294 start_codon:yes stop_codon:yes gene_type:complete